MEEPLPVKRRRTESPKDVSADGNVAKQWSESREINTVSVKPDKFQKLRRIATNCTGKIQNPKSDDIVFSSVGSSPASSPRPENMTALSTPVDASELHARLTVLVLEEDKENCRLKSGDENLQAGGGIGKEVKSAESDVKGDTIDKNTNISVSAEEFYAVVRKMVSEKMRKLEESYNEKIIPDLEEKIANLETENRCLQEHAKKLQEMLTKVVTEYQKQQQKPVQVHAGVQVGTSEPPSLTPVSSVRQTVAPGNLAQVVHVIDSVPGLYKPPSSTQTLVTQVSSPASAYTLRGASMANGIRQATVNTNTGHVFTSSAGQPRMYSEAPYKPGSHPNAVVAPRSHATYSRPPGPIMATVYPQPQNHPTSLGVPRASPPTQSSPSRFPYNPQTANGVMIRPPGQQNVQYVVNQERKDNSTGQPLGVRQKSPSVQGPPPAYSATNSRPQHHQQQQQVYRPGPATNPAAQVNGVHHYQVRQAAPSGGMVGAPTGPPPLVRAPSNMRPQVNNAPRYQTPMRHRAPYQQNTPGSDPRAQASAVSSRHPGAPPPPSQTSPPQANGIVRDQLPPIPVVSISGASNGIVLSWNMTIPDGCAPIDSYQLFAYQNNSTAANSPSLWKKLGIVKALPLPMACTLTQFVSGSMYYFAVRAIDVHGRAGGYSSPCAITLPNESDKGRA